jgi:hypothetical protein
MIGGGRDFWGGLTNLALLNPFLPFFSLGGLLKKRPRLILGLPSLFSAFPG